jgi:hypothetical protein
MANKELHKLYDGTVEIVFYPDSHQYRLNGQRLQSVTTILGQIDKSRPLLLWAKNLSRIFFKKFIGKKISYDVIEEGISQFEVKRDEASDHGTLVHDWITNFITATLLGTDKPKFDTNMPNEVLLGIRGFLNWYNSHKVEFLKSENLIYSKKFGYVGKFDVHMIVDGRHTLGDFKTGKTIYPEALLQLSAYHNALREEFPKVKVQDYSILHFNKEDGTFEVVTVKPEEVDFNVFVSLINQKKVLADLKTLIERQCQSDAK